MRLREKTTKSYRDMLGESESEGEGGEGVADVQLGSEMSGEDRVEAKPAARKTKPAPVKRKSTKKAESEEDEQYTAQDDGASEEGAPSEHSAEDTESEEKETPRKRVRATPKSAQTAKPAPSSGGRKSSITKAQLQKTLKALTPAQVIELVVTLAQQRPDVKDDIVALLPHTDVPTLIKNLQKENGRIWRAFPHSRFGNMRDHFCYKRVAPSLSAFRSYFHKQIQPLASSKNWDDFLAYAGEALDILRGLPHWSDPSDNTSYPPLFKKVLRFLKACLATPTLSTALRARALELQAKYRESRTEAIQRCGYSYRPGEHSDSDEEGDPAGSAGAEEKSAESAAPAAAEENEVVAAKAVAAKADAGDCAGGEAAMDVAPLATPVKAEPAGV